MAIEAVPLAPSSPFQEWQRAITALRTAEARGDAHPDILRLSAEVIRAHNAMTSGHGQLPSRPGHGGDQKIRECGQQSTGYRPAGDHPATCSNS